MQRELFYLEKGHCIFYYLYFVTMPGWVHHGNSFFLCVFTFRGEGDWVKVRLSRHTTKKEILLFADALRISKGLLVISFTLWIIALDCYCMWWRKPWFHLWKINKLFHSLYPRRHVFENLISHIFWGNTHICTHKHNKILMCTLMTMYVDKLCIYSDSIQLHLAL